jgi:MoxR-like ATPase
MSELTIEERDRKLNRILEDADIRALGEWRSGKVVSTNGSDSTWNIKVDLDKESRTVDVQTLVDLEVPVSTLQSTIHKSDRVKFRMVSVDKGKERIEDRYEVIKISDHEYAALQEERRAMGAENLRRLFLDLQELSRTWNEKIEASVQQKFEVRVEELADRGRQIIEKELLLAQREQDLLTREQVVSDKQKNLVEREERVASIEKKFLKITEYIRENEDEVANRNSPIQSESYKTYPIEEVTSRWEKLLNSDSEIAVAPHEERSLISVLTAWATGGLVLLNGPVGVGKTHIVRNTAHVLSGSKDYGKIVPVRPNWLDTSDLLGFYDPVSELFRPSPFMNCLADANMPQRMDRLHVIGLDEINLSRFENYAADLMSRLEYSSDENLEPINLYAVDTGKMRFDRLNEVERTKQTTIQFKNLLRYPAEFRIPRNIVIIGTLNTDESTFDISPKLIDRSFVIDFHPVRLPNSLADILSGELAPAYVSLADIRNSLNRGDITSYQSDWDELVKLSSDYFELGIGMPFGRRFYNHFRAWAHVCVALGIQKNVAVSHFYVSKVLPRIRFSKSMDTSLGDTFRRMLEKIKGVITEQEHMRELEPFSAQLQSDIDFVRYFGRGVM